MVLLFRENSNQIKIIKIFWQVNDMKTYIAQLEFPTDFYPPLTKEQTIDLYDQHLFRPLRDHAFTSEGEILIKEELHLIGRAVIEATEKSAKTLRNLGFHLQLKKN